MENKRKKNHCTLISKFKCNSHRINKFFYHILCNFLSHPILCSFACIKQLYKKIRVRLAYLQIWKLDLPLHRKSSAEEGISNWLVILSNLSDKKKLWNCFIECKTATSAVNNALTGLWSENFSSPLLYTCCFNPFPYQIIRSHLN